MHSVVVGVVTVVLIEYDGQQTDRNRKNTTGRLSGRGYRKYVRHTSFFPIVLNISIFPSIYPHSFGWHVEFTHSYLPTKTMLNAKNVYIS